MLFLLASINNDKTTNMLIDWITYYNHDFIRINQDEPFIDRLDILLDNQNHFVKLKQISLVNTNNIMLVLWRDSYSWMHSKLLLKSNKLNKDIDDFFFREVKRIKETIYSIIISNRNIIVNYNNKINKFETLNKARLCGLLMPKFIIASSKIELIKFKNLNNRIIIKPLSYCQSFSVDNSEYSIFTSELNDLEISRLDDHFFPVFSQQLIEKRFDIKVFFLNGHLFPMAIIPVKAVSSIDCRNRTEAGNQRNVPYKLDHETERSIIELMELSKLKFGTIDLIKSLDGLMYFLEINPVGQFGMISYHCNIPLEKFLIDNIITTNNGN